MTERNQPGWREILREMYANETLYEPPAEVTSQVLRLAGAGPSDRSPQLATLVYDSLRDPRAAGIRSHAAGSRHVICRSGDVELRINLQPCANGRISLAGQVLTEGAAGSAGSVGSFGSVEGCDIWVACNDRLFSTRSDDCGEFLLQNLPSAEYRIAVLLAAGSILVPAI